MRSFALLLAFSVVAAAGAEIPLGSNLRLDEKEILPQLEEGCYNISPSFLSFGASANRFEFAYDRAFGAGAKTYRRITGHPADALFWARLGGGAKYSYDQDRQEYALQDDVQTHLVGNLLSNAAGDCTTSSMVMTDRTWPAGVELKVDIVQLFRKDEEGKPRSTIAAFNCRLNVRDGELESELCRRLRRCVEFTIWDQLDLEAVPAEV